MNETKKIKQKTLKQKNDETRTKLAHQVGIEPTYSNYSINVCLEGRWDTDALFWLYRQIL